MRIARRGLKNKFPKWEFRLRLRRHSVTQRQCALNFLQAARIWEIAKWHLSFFIAFWDVTAPSLERSGRRASRVRNSLFPSFHTNDTTTGYIIAQETLELLQWQKSSFFEFIFNESHKAVIWNSLFVIPGLDRLKNKGVSWGILYFATLSSIVFSTQVCGCL